MNKVYAVAGLSYGDEGKGSIVDFLSEKFESTVVVRYNGGPQAAHNVVKNGRSHCFSQFGSGTFRKYAKTYLSEYMLIDPLSLEAEEEALRKKGVKNGFDRLFIDENCTVITPFQKITGRMRELKKRKGSCGMGVGETARDESCLGDYTLKAGDLGNKKTLEKKLDFLRRYKLDQAEQFFDGAPENKKMRFYYSRIKDASLPGKISALYSKIQEKLNISSGYEIPEGAVFEGAQGILLDKKHGFFPHITKTDITFENAKALSDGKYEVKKIGVLRAYMTRHGKGPFVSEENSIPIPELQNSENEWQGRFRKGWFDAAAGRYALKASGGVDFIALTHLDSIKKLKELKVCTAYEYRGGENIDSFFDCREEKGRKIIKDIKVKEAGNQEERIKLTSLLFKCWPVYREFNPKNEGEYIDFIESEDGLKTPVKIVSRGPESKDKEIQSTF